MNVKLLFIKLKVLLGILILCQSCDKLNSIKKNSSKYSVDKDSTAIELPQDKIKASSLSLDKLVIKEKEEYLIYVDKTSPKFKNKECFYPYIKKDNDGKIELYLKIQYLDVEWLNIESYMITSDKADYVINGNIEKTIIKGKKSYHIETLNKLITSDKDIKTLESIANGEHVTALFIGKNNYKKRILSQKKRTAFRNVLDAYYFLKNQ